MKRGSRAAEGGMSRLRPPGQTCGQQKKQVYVGGQREEVGTSIRRDLSLLENAKLSYILNRDHW